MGVALGVVAAIALGVPLVALAVVRRLPPPRLRPVLADARHDWARRHRLGPADQSRIQQAVAEGRRVRPESLVPAARGYAELVVSWSRRGVRERRPLLWSLLVAAYLALTALAVWKAPAAAWGLAFGLINLVLSERSRRNARRALEANQIDDRHTGNGASQTDLPLSLG